MSRTTHGLLGLLVVVSGGALLVARAGPGPSGSKQTKKAQVPRSTGLTGTRVLDLDGKVHVLGGRDGSRPIALVFLGTECPISNRMVPRLNRMAAAAKRRGVQFLAVYSDPFATHAEARTHRDTFKVAFTALFDEAGSLGRRLAPTHVPEAFLLDREGRVVYRGAIDDSWAARTRPRAVVTRHFLSDAVAAIASARPIKIKQSKPVGCLFESAKEPIETVPVTYTRHIAPLLQKHCVECHRKGEVAPFALTSYRSAARRAKLLAEVTRDELMPPWSPAPGHGKFLDERRLSATEKQLLERWAKAGAPRGNPADLPPAPKPSSGYRLGKPDLVLEMKDSFTVPAEGDDVFRCFVLPTRFPKDTYVVGFQFIPGNPKVVHHAIAFLDSGKRGRKLDARTKEAGYPSFGGIGFAPSGAVGGWAPGAPAVRLPDGIGRLVRKDADVVLQVHYHPNGKVETDRSRVALYLAKKPIKRRMQGLILGTVNIDIPPNEKTYVRRAKLEVPADVVVHSIAPHMHYLGREMKVWAVTPDKKTVPMIWMKDWDFRWQGGYLYRKPLRLPKGTTIHLYASYDNSEDNPDNPSNPPKRVRHGDQTTNEMCLCFLGITTDSPSDFNKLRQAMFRMFMEGRRQ